MSLTLKPEPDGFGYLYGEYIDGSGQRFRVDVMPPKSHWRGDIMLTENPPHETDWVIYADGEELGRVRKADDLAGIIGERLAIAKR